MGGPETETGITTREIIKPKQCMGIRHVQALMLCLLHMLAFSMRVNMSMAIVSMTDSSKEDSFNWSAQIQSVILSSFFWGYVVLQIPAGELASKLGGRWPITIMMAINSLVLLFLPLGAINGGWQAVCACRVIQGLSQGFLFPSSHTLIGQWVPLEEKSRLGTLIYSGGQFGTALQLIISGFISESWGWQGIFYINGILGALWTVVYIFIGSNSPNDSKVISAEERDYIQSSLGHGAVKEKKYPTPWKKIWTSLPFFALIVVHCGQNWGFWTLMTEMPSYFSKVLNVDIKSNGVMSALPYLAMYLMGFPFGYISDWLLRKKILSITGSRKLSNTIGHWGPALALIGLIYAPAGNVLVAVGLLTVVVGLNAGQYTGFLLVHIDMAPNFAGNLMGITNCAANIISIIAPLAAGVLLKDETSADDWKKVFYLSSAIYLLANLFFLIFGTSEVQEWNEPSNVTEKENKTEKVV